MLSDIRVNESCLGAEPTALNFYTALMQANPGRFRQGDELRFVRLTQRINPVTGFPYVEGRVTTYVFDSNKRLTLSQLMASMGGSDGFLARNGRLCAERHEESLVAWVHRRPKGRDKALVSMQNLVGHNSKLFEYTSQEARYQAMHSYGPVRQGHTNEPLHLPEPQQNDDDNQ